MKFRLEVSKSGPDEWVLRVFDDDRKIVSGSGKTPLEAVTWVLHHLERITEQTENHLVALGIVTQADIDAYNDRD